MIQIRKGVFETNSSSTHSVTIDSYILDPSRLEVGEDGYIHVELQEFGWGVDMYRDQYTKLSYLLTMALQHEGLNYCECDDDEDEVIKEIEQEKYQKRLENCDIFMEISDEIAKYTGTKGIIVDLSEGEIDHQSYYSSIYDFLNDYDVSDIIEFVFCSGIELVISNDNM